MKTNFEHVLFTDKSRETLDGPDGWMSGWLLNGATPQSRIRRQQGGGCVMIWAGIINDAIVDLFAVLIEYAKNLTINQSINQSINQFTQGTLIHNISQ